MIDYLNNLIPRLKKYSKDLDKIEIFVDKSWVFIDESNNHHEYVFSRDGRLIMSLNGIVIFGKWELLPTKKLLIDRVQDQVMLNNLFINKDILMLQKNGTDDHPFILVNQDEIRDLDYMKYLRDMDDRAKIDSELSNAQPRITINNKVVGDNLFVGQLLKTENDILISGNFSHISNEKKYFEISNNRIDAIYYIQEYSYVIDGCNEKIQLKVTSFNNISKGDSIINDQNLIFPINKKFEIKSLTNEYYMIAINENSIIIKYTEDDMTVLLYIGILLIIFISIIILVTQF